MQAKFEIEFTSHVPGMGYLVCGKSLDNNNFWINETTKLDGVPIRYGDIPRKLDENGKARLDCWCFVLANDADHKKFQVGQIAVLESERTE